MRQPFKLFSFFIRRTEKAQNFMRLFVTERLILGLAAALVTVFMPIFLFEVSGRQFWFVGMFYGVSILLYLLLLIPGMKITNKIGFSKALALSMFVSFFYHIGLFFVNTENIFQFLPFLVIGTVIVRIFHWVPYHVDFIKFTDTQDRGKNVAITFATVAIMGMCGPILASFIIEYAGYSILFALVAFLVLAAGISYLFLEDVYEEFTWTYKETFTNLFSEKYRLINLASFASGTEQALHVIVWPIFLYTLLNDKVLEVGGISALTVGATVIVQLFIGAYIDIDKKNTFSVLRKGSILGAIGWAIKIFVVSALHVFLVGVYHNIVRIFLKTPYNSILYDAAGEQGHYVDEVTVMRELTHFSGRLFGISAMVVLTFYIPLSWVFGIGVVASLLFSVATIHVQHNK